MARKKEFLVYGLRDPCTGEIRYVGRSAYGLARPNAHRRKVKKGVLKTYRDYWIASLLSRGLDYEIVVLQRFSTGEGVADAERWWIAVGKVALGKRLTNLTDGGEGTIGYKRTEEQLENLRAVQKRQASSPEGRAHLEKMWKKRDTPEAQANLRKSSRERYATPEGEAHLRRIQELSHSKEAREKRSRAAKERWDRPKDRELLSAGLVKGREWCKTEEGRKVKSRIAKERASTPEGLKQILSALEKTHTPEAREKITAHSRARAATLEGRAQIEVSIKQALEAMETKRAGMTPEQLSVEAKKAWVGISPERRSEIAREREARKRERRLVVGVL